ncbi:hypothetical protein [Solicola sp. PLA-1-18]|uniref:hypothetical protein n=1 Tax=Solicola sp. PLA-1-18 TaxID=3380532 RepID=UPI003B7DC230
MYGYAACESTLSKTLGQYRSYGYTPTNVQRCFSRFGDGWWSFSFDYAKKSNNG